MYRIFKYSMMIMITAGLINATEFSVYEANYPGIKDYNINIDEARLDVRSQGNFIEMNVTMTVSYDFESWFFKNYDELEFLWQFSLPEQAIMHGFWIWQDDSLLTAEVLDKWTAALLFSDVSTPVRHPGLLAQSSPDRNGQVHYDLKLFPLMRGKATRFKIQYLLPGRPSVNSLRAWLPTTQLISENTPGIDTLCVVYHYDETPYQPGIIGTDVSKSRHFPGQSAWMQTLPLEYDQFVEMVLPSPVKDGLYFSTYEQNGEHFYHLAVYPPDVPPTNRHRNILIMIDFNRYNTSGLDGEFILTLLKETLQTALSEEDSINVMVAYEDIVSGADTWVSASEANLDVLFSRVMQRSFPSYSYFMPMVSRAAEYCHRQSGESEVLFITNTDEVSLGDYDREVLADRVLDMFPTATRLHFIDLDNKSSLQYRWQYIGGYSMGYYETQLQSFYGRMADASEGNLFFLKYHDIKTILTAMFYESISHFERMEIQMRFQQGYAHSQHLMALHEGYYPLNTPIMQVGKYSGELPVEVKIFGKVHMDKVEKTLTITQNDLSPGGEAIATSWYGDHIRSLVHQPYDPLTVNDIIQLSIDQHVSTPYSSFLVYHPDLHRTDQSEETSENNSDSGNKGGENEWDAGGGGSPTVTVDAAEPDFSIRFSAYPNPFNHRIMLEVTLPEPDHKEVELILYNTMGQVIMQFILQPGENRFIWDARDDAGRQVSTGVYYAVLRGSTFKKSVKLVYMQ